MTRSRFYDAVVIVVSSIGVISACLTPLIGGDPAKLIAVSTWLLVMRMFTRSLP